jgi:hypothetical protein
METKLCLSTYKSLLTNSDISVNCSNATATKSPAHTEIKQAYSLYKYLKSHALNVMVKWLTLLLRIREVLGSNLGPETGYPR